MFSQFYKNYKTQVLMLAILCLSAFFCVLYPTLSKICFQIFLLVSLPLFYIKFNVFRKDWFFLFLFFSLIVQTLSWVSSIYFYPEFSNDYPKLDRLIKLFSFLFIAYWLNASQKRVFYVLASFLIGFIVNLFLSPDLFSDLALSLNGKRVDFGVKNAQYTSMFSGFFIVLLVFYLYKFACKPFLFKKVRKTMLAVLTTFLLVYIFVLLVSQSRQVWLGMLVIIFLFPLIFKLFFSFKGWLNISTFYFLVISFLFLLSSFEAINKRVVYALESDFQLVQNLISNKDNKYLGFGIRINSWLDTFEWIKENPILGAGPNAIGEVIKRSDRLPEKVKQRIGHLHSFHLEILVAYGILGSLVIYGMYYWLIRSLVLAHRENPELKMYTVLGICFLIFWIIINFFESFSSRSYGVYVHNIMFGCLYTFYFTQQRKKIEEAEACA